MRQEAASHPPDQPDLAFFIPSYRAGGAEQAVIRLANWCSQQGLRVDLLVLNDDGPLGARIDSSVNQINLKRPRAVFAFLPLRRYMLKAMPRLLVSNMSHLNVLSVLARGTQTDIHIMLVEHCDVAARTAWDGGLKEKVLFWLMHWTYPTANLIAAGSRGAARSLWETLELSPQRVSVLPNSVDVQSIREAAGQKVAHPWLVENDGHPLIAAIGELVPSKGFADLLEAFALLQRTSDARLIIIGEGPQREALETLRSRLDLQEMVDLPGYLPQPVSIVAGADVFVLSSHSEGQGMVLLEAMAAGTPIVATDCPTTPRELLVDGKAGLLVPVEDPELMAAAIGHLLNDKDLGKSLREKAFSRVEAFHIDAVGRRFLQLCIKAGIPQDLAMETLKES